jgi:signal transduction histidine kinase
VVSRRNRRGIQVPSTCQLVGDQTIFGDLHPSCADEADCSASSALSHSIAATGDSEPVWIVGCASQLQQRTVNLLLNTIQALPAGGQIRIAAHRDCRAFVRDGLKIGASSLVCMVVEDDGVGMNPHVHERIFEPMFTTRDAPQSVGLGLTAVAAVVEAHRRFVDVRTAPGLGTRVTVFLQSDSATGPCQKAVDDRAADAVIVAHRSRYAD